MEYLSRDIGSSKIVVCSVSFISRKVAENLHAVPSAKSLLDACCRFNAERMYGGVLLTNTLVHIEAGRNEVMARLKFSYDKDRPARMKAKKQVPYLDEEVDEFPSIDLGHRHNTPLVLEELIVLSRSLASRNVDRETDRQLLSDMLQEVAIVLAKTTSQGSA